jgi:hypothetical protein
MRPVKTERLLLTALAIGALVACSPKQPASAAPEEAAPGVVEGAPGEGEVSPTNNEPVVAQEPAPVDEDACGASQYQSLIGTNAAAVTLPTDLVHRIYKNTDAVTMDYSPYRLNIVTDADGVITEVKCG